MIKRCPRCGGNEFVVYGHVVQKWLVNKFGLCQKVLDDCIEVTHDPTDNDIWTCKKCCISAKGEYFNVEE